ncbi:MAG: glycosyltransferase family 9 protein, partial [Acidobacteriota bacterium]|nr:glycosyltransferase family 9 protein [Acidobacteriota bacterium]
MGDILHTLPAVASLKRGVADAHVTWVVESRWRPLLEGNPFVDRIVELRRGSWRGMLATARELRAEPFDLAVDFQGLIKSALTASLARARRIYGYHRSQTREWAAGLFYSHTLQARATHVVDRHLELAAAAGAAEPLKVFPLPEGRDEGGLPVGDFVLASPLAGWRAKQWPLENYQALARLLQSELRVPLVLDGPASAQTLFAAVDGVIPHSSGLPGLIYATRRAAAVVGVDS